MIFLISSDQIRRSIFRSFYQAQQQAAFEQISAFLEQGVWFDGLFTGNDLMAFGAIEASQQRGIRVPEDVSVVGYDDIQAASYFNPKINYRPSGQAVAWPKATELLMKLMTGELR